MVFMQHSTCELQKIWRVNQGAHTLSRRVMHLDLREEHWPVLPAAVGSRKVAAPAARLVPAAVLAWLHTGELSPPTCRQAASKHNT